MVSKRLNAKLTIKGHQKNLTMTLPSWPNLLLGLWAICFMTKHFDYRK